MAEYDVIVIGGGTMGIASAWDLAKRGKRVLVLEQFDFVHDRGAHSGQTRIFRHAYAEGAEYIPLVLRADELWQQLEAEARTRILHRVGGLEMAAPGYLHASRARESPRLAARGGVQASGPVRRTVRTRAGCRSQLAKWCRAPAWKPWCDASRPHPPGLGQSNRRARGFPAGGQPELDGPGGRWTRGRP